MSSDSVLKRTIITTQDGSKTLQIADWNEQYHSHHGAVQEAIHVFLKNGLHQILSKEEINILEMGFGTGLNTLLVCLEAEKLEIPINYTTLEKYPITKEEWKTIAYPSFLGKFYPENNHIPSLFEKIHTCSWNEFVSINNYFRLKKIQTDFKNINESSDTFDLILFDAFGIRVQPDLWTGEVFSELYNLLNNNGLLTTYACNGNARRALQSVGFTVKKLPGPPGKREMMNAWKY